MIEDEISFLKKLSKPNRNAGYDKLSKIVNEAMKRHDGDILKTMKETGESFSIVFECSGWKDEYDFLK
jgi:hypothetical protein